MQRIFICLILLFVCLFIMHPLTAIDLEETQSAKEVLPILELLPGLLSPLAVEPGIPSDFIALSPRGALDLSDWIYWGPKDVLKAYFENPASLNVPIIRVKLSANVTQTGPNSFSEGPEHLKMMQKKDPKEFAFIETQWGDYPLLAIKTRVNNQLIFTTWVGLNDPDAGWTLMFNLVYPEKDGHPNKEDLQLWENLLTKTTQLKDGDYFKACGQDLQEGYTRVNFGGAKLKMVAEKRLRDGVIQVVVIPEDPSVQFHYTDMMEGLMGAKWKYGEPMVKVYGEIEVKKGRVESHIEHVTSILLKTVPEFSFKKEEEKKLLIFQKEGLFVSP